MKHHTKDKGDLGVGYVIADLLSKGIQPFIPISEHQACDLIGLFQDGSCKRISVKYRKLTKHGTVSVPFKSTYSDSHGIHVKDTDKSTIDIMAIYCPESNKVYYINPSDFNKSISLRINPSKNKQATGINVAANFMTP